MKIANCKFEKLGAMPIGEVGAFILREGARLRAAADRTENVEQLEAIEAEMERLIVAAKKIQSGALGNPSRVATSPYPL